MVVGITFTLNLITVVDRRSVFSLLLHIKGKLLASKVKEISLINYN